MESFVFCAVEECYKQLYACDSPLRKRFITYVKIYFLQFLCTQIKVKNDYLLLRFSKLAC